MKDNTTDKQTKVGRRTLLSGFSVAAVAGLAASATSAPASAQSRGNGFRPTPHTNDTWMNELSGSHRVFIDSATLPGGANAMRYANNILTVNGEDYDGDDSDYAMIVCFRHTSTPYAFNDAIWAKYGAYLDRRADPAHTTNPMNTANAGNGQNTIAGLVDRGVRFAICNRATRSFSRMLAGATGAEYEDVYQELLANAIPNGRFVPAGVMAATRAQEFRYSLLYAE